MRGARRPAVRQAGTDLVTVDRMSQTPSSSRPVVMFDVLGTLVDQAGSLRRRITEVTGVDGAVAAGLADRWLGQVGEQEEAVAAGRRPFAPSDELDRAALDELVREGLLPPEAVAGLADASRWQWPWPDALAGLDLLAAECTVVAVSNASRRDLTGLSTRAGLRWHQTVSAQDVGTYKPARAVYERALACAPSGAPTPYLVAAHAWDLRAAAAAGMRTAYVPRPGGDEPRADDAFDLYATDLTDLHAQLVGA
ncbi:2-haloacid dehalogenase [Promicromonospora thailandica]|uniref:2-haloacid dehalogenase n=2 Tax=Promicromonospora thailandica TaxID=765201 RepID=A0A9X2G835_9MICO|nr:2-haloacid dehalogenase [Promicromonospora thailandica]